MIKKLEQFCCVWYSHRCTVYHLHLIILVDRIYWWLGCKLFSWICTLHQSWKKVLMSHTFDEISMVQHLKCSCDNKCDRIVMWPITWQRLSECSTKKITLNYMISPTHQYLQLSVNTGPRSKKWTMMIAGLGAQVVTAMWQSNDQGRYNTQPFPTPRGLTALFPSFQEAQRILLHGWKFRLPRSRRS